jgi:hypothetical protein
MKNINTENSGPPVYLKTEDNGEWPKEKLFYLLTGDGMFLCRNHQWFQSCVKSNSGPGGLAKQEEFCRLSYPDMPKALLEKAVGFFHHIYKKHHWESALILVWNRQAEAMELVCPEQKASCAAVQYDIPTLPPHLAVIGDIHSHCNFSPKPSDGGQGTDTHDELHRPGIHIIVGGIEKEPPEFYCAAVVDGERFEVKDINDVIEDYRGRDDQFPQEWLAKVKEKKWEQGGGYYGGGGGHYGSYGSYKNWNGDYEKQQREREMKDREAIRKTLMGFHKREKCPTLAEVQQALFRATDDASMLVCEAKAEKFIEAWPKIKAYHEKQSA